MDAHAEDGFTLPELLISIAILAIIIAPLTMSFVVGLSVVGKVDQKFNDSRSSLISAADFANDVANASLITTGSASPCGASSVTNVVLVTLAWSDAAIATDGSATKNNKVSYTYDTTNKKLLRRYCANGGTPNESVPAVSLSGQPVVSCYSAGNVANATCNTDVTAGAVTRWVKLDVAAAPNSPTQGDPSPTPYSFTLEGTRRPV